MAHHVGQRFGSYRLKRLLSERGAFADVYEGEHVSERTQVAVKVWKVQIEAETFLNDVHAAVLTHPHIVKILDFGIERGIPYLVMAYAPHGSLQTQPFPLPPASIVAYVRDIADGLYYAHQRGIVHRDIKPDNILLGPQREIWVGDFGIATPSSTWQEKPEKQRAAGTYAYMAPEQMDGYASSASDQYALGIMVYEWLCGERPFHGDAAALYSQHHFVSPPPLRTKVPTISPQVEQVVLKALAKEPQQRFPSIQAFSAALEQALLPPRKIALFGYETDGGRNAVLWNNPQVFFSDTQHAVRYAAWNKTKRSFTQEEILDGIWIKASDTGNYYQVRFHSDGNLTESTLLDPSTRWRGSWKLLDEVLRVNIGGYELDIFANAEGFRHSGIEFYRNEDTPCAYFTILHIPGWNKKRWDDMYEVVDLVHRMYEQVLSRRADESGLITYGAMLHRGEKSVREIVKILGLSLEYREHFITPFVEANEIEAPLELCYEHFLGRNADELGRREYTKVAQTQGFDTVIDALIESEEYKKSFGEDDLPPTTTGLAVATRQPNHLECFYRGQDNRLRHRWWYGSEWSREGLLGDVLTSAPAAISWGGDRIDCFYRGQGGHLYHRWWDGSRWNDEENLGGLLISAPAVASRWPNHLECFYRGKDNALWHRWWYGSEWSGEGWLGGILTSAPAAVSWGGDRIDCFYRGGDNSLWHRWWDGSRWSDEDNLGGWLASAPAVVSWGPNRVDCFYRDRQNHLHHRWWNGSDWSQEE
jgi:serine/threonine protein kinase